jgi:flagellar basal-body rod protein FlgB
MDPTRSGPIALAESRLRWADRRQQVLAQNIANADTPGFRPGDLRPFAQALTRASAGLVRTDPRHLPPAHSNGGQVVQDRRAAERAPNGNAVALDEQALKVAETDSAHALAMGLHRRYLGLFRTALGRQG